MVRRTLLIILDSLQNESTSELFKHFYKVSLSEICKIPDGVFTKILLNPTSKDLLSHLYSIHSVKTNEYETCIGVDSDTLPNLLVLIVMTKDKTGYIGVIKDAFSRKWSIQIPVTLSWDQYIECARQTSKSPISFN